MAEWSIKGEWEILATTVSEIKGPFFVPISVDWDGTKTKASIGGAEVVLEPHHNPVTGEEHEVHTMLLGGFVWTDCLACVATKNVANVEGLDFDWSGQNGYFAKVEWSNAHVLEGAKTKFGR